MTTMFSRINFKRKFSLCSTIVYLISPFVFTKLSISSQGTNVTKAKQLILDAKLKVISVDDFAQAAETSVKLALMMNIAKSLNLDITFSAKSPQKDFGKVKN